MPTAISLHPPRELTVKGTPYEIGFQHGEAFREEISDFLNDHIARINLLRSKPLTYEKAISVASHYALVIERCLPEVAEEITGLADGARLSYLEAVILQIRRELIRNDTEPNDCSSCTLQEAGRTVLAQTIDQAGGMQNLGIILKIVPIDPSKPKICMYTFVGLCGYLGFNSSGLAIGINMVYSPGWRVGIPIYLLVRALLSRHSLVEAMADIRSIERASSRYLTLADTHSAIGLEMTATSHRVLRRHPLVHTNHFIHPSYCQLDESHEAARIQSRFRLRRMRSLLRSGCPLQLVLRDHDGYPGSICAHNSGNIARAETVGATIVYPETHEMWALAGHPCEQSFHQYLL